MSKMRLTDKEDKPTGMQSTETGTEESTEKSTEKSAGKPTKSTKSTKILLKPPFESASVKSTGWSPKRTSKDDYRVPMTVGCNI